MKIFNYSILGTLLLMASCFGQKELEPTAKVITVVQQENEFDVVLRYNEKYDLISSIQIPIQFEISNSSSSDRYFKSLQYIYKNPEKVQSVPLYFLKGKELEKETKRLKKKISNTKPKKYFVYSKHLVDTLKFNRDYFQEYITKLKEGKVKRLPVGNLADFKSKHAELLKSLLANDSIRLYFDEVESLKSKEASVLFPVKW